MLISIGMKVLKKGREYYHGGLKIKPKFGPRKGATEFLGTPHGQSCEKDFRRKMGN